MNPSHTLLNELIGRNGFAELRVPDLCAGSTLLDIVTEKINQLNPMIVSEKQLAGDVGILVEVLRETLAKRYAGLSVLAFAHILLALDHFVRVPDKKPDTQVGGYVDDLQVVQNVLHQFQAEFDAFRAWKSKVGTNW